MLLLRRAASAAAPFCRAASAAAPFRALSALAVEHPPPPTNFAALLAEARAAAAERELAAVWKIVEAKEAASKAALAAADKLAAQTVAAADKRVASMEQTVASMEQTIATKDAIINMTSTVHAAELAAAKRATDVAMDRLSVRAVLETSIAEAFASWDPPLDDAKTPSERLLKMLDAHTGCEGLKAYMRVAASDNSVPPDDVLNEGRKLHSTFCSRAHEGVFAVVSDGVGPTALVAYTALVSFTGRRLRLYGINDPRAVPPLTMRVLRYCMATEAQIRASPKLIG